MGHNVRRLCSESRHSYLSFSWAIRLHNFVCFTVPMTRFPFVTSPDALFLEVPARTEGLLLQPFETQWGITGEKLCYYHGILIEMAVSGQPDRVGAAERTQISLLPKLDGQREYDWPSIQAFKSKVTECLTNAEHWLLWCECDRDQYPVVQVKNDLTTTIVMLDAALSYCEGETLECPSFSCTHE